jgi:hypothetical protein
MILCNLLENYSRKATGLILDDKAPFIFFPVLMSDVALSPGVLLSLNQWIFQFFLVEKSDLSEAFSVS